MKFIIEPDVICKKTNNIRYGKRTMSSDFLNVCMHVQLSAGLVLTCSAIKVMNENVP